MTASSKASDKIILYTKPDGDIWSCDGLVSGWSSTAFVSEVCNWRRDGSAGVCIPYFQTDRFSVRRIDDWDGKGYYVVNFGSSIMMKNLMPLATVPRNIASMVNDDRIHLLLVMQFEPFLFNSTLDKSMEGWWDLFRVTLDHLGIMRHDSVKILTSCENFPQERKDARARICYYDFFAMHYRTRLKFKKVTLAPQPDH